MDNQTKRWKKRPEGSNWGDFGPDDRVGRLNLLTPERRFRAVSEVREGLAFALSLPLDYPGGVDLNNGLRHPPKLFASSRGDHVTYNTRLGAVDISSDDGVVLSNQYSTQWDSLAHVGQLFDAEGDGIPEPLYYNGYRAGEDVLGPDQTGGPHAGPLGMEHMAATGAQGRGVLVNLFQTFGPARRLVSYDDLMQSIDEQGVEVLEGDFLLLYTGYDEMLLAMNKAPDVPVLDRFGTALDGSDQKLLDWVTTSGIVAICSDNPAVEGLESMKDPKLAGRSLLPLHEHCLFKLGIHLGELWFLRDLAGWLAEHQRSAFLLTAPPLRLPGAVGSPTTPVATV